MVAADALETEPKIKAAAKMLAIFVTITVLPGKRLPQPSVQIVRCENWSNQEFATERSQLIKHTDRQPYCRRERFAEISLKQQLGYVAERHRRTGGYPPCQIPASEAGGLVPSRIYLCRCSGGPPSPVELRLQRKLDRSRLASHASDF
jgi:hypothetical protein